MRKMISALALCLCFVGGMTGAVAAAGVPPAEGDSVPAYVGDVSVEAAKAIFEAFKSGNATLGVLLVLIAGVTLLRKYGSKKWPALGSDFGGSMLLAGLTLLGTLAASAGAGGWAGVSDPSVLWRAFKLAAYAGGGYTLIKRAMKWALAKWGEKLPGWMRSVLEAGMWIFDSAPGAGAAVAVEKAKAAGEAAVKANPPSGVGPTGTIP